MPAFSKKKFATAPAVASEGFRPPEALMRALTNPYIGAGGAAGLFLLTTIGLIAAMGDPQAGTPVVRISLAKVAAMAAPPGWREALLAENGEAPALTEDVYSLSETPGGVGGEATITLPGGHAYRPVNPLPPAPIEGVTVNGPNGPLPVIGGDGRTPAQAYARPFTSNGRPKIALVVGGLGLNAQATRQAIEGLPPEVTLSFVPYSENLQGWIDLARSNGHEVLIEAPMEPVDYPENDPGPYTLMSRAMPAETVKKLEWVLSRATGYFGVTNYLGSRFMAADQAMNTFQDALRSRGLAFIDDGSAVGKRGGLPRASADRIVDDELSAESIDNELLALEAGALQKGQALGSAFAYPVTISQIAQWAQSVESRGYQLAPASALTSRR